MTRQNHRASSGIDLLFLGLKGQGEGMVIWFHNLKSVVEWRGLPDWKLEEHKLSTVTPEERILTLLPSNYFLVPPSV